MYLIYQLGMCSTLNLKNFCLKYVHCLNTQNHTEKVTSVVGTLKDWWVQRRNKLSHELIIKCSQFLAAFLSNMFLCM
jgi:hypothetical protein